MGIGRITPTQDKVHSAVSHILNTHGTQQNRFDSQYSLHEHFEIPTLNQTYPNISADS